MAILVDTSFWIAHLDATDRNHAAALSESPRIGSGERGQTVTTDFVLDELATFLNRKWGARKSAETVSSILDSGAETVFIDHALFTEALEVLRRDGRPGFSLTDAATVALAKARSIETVATFDREFDRYLTRVPRM